ncbi:MAG: tRNA (adenosine(37)-N6)-threonylcarbamoyltransferase complex ATPase subunit type 1 TsaE [Bacteroidota bacterium]|nr:tRNA (adenosine(37)-N6)-threonylcarbamoyltransferase complex ATPase subunit type 1 TsaE [Bacteroidota bacterium]
MKKFNKLKLNEYQKVFEYLFIENNHKIIIFNGEIGAGKTTLIQYFSRRLSVDSKVLSPTFSIINEYKIKNGLSIYHFDLLRLKSKKELFGIGFLEYLESDNYCFIEWPKIALDYIQDKFFYIDFEINDDSTRNLLISIC